MLIKSQIVHGSKGNLTILSRHLPPRKTHFPKGIWPTSIIISTAGAGVMNQRTVFQFLILSEFIEWAGFQDNAICHN